MLENYVENFLLGQGNLGQLLLEYEKQICAIEKYKSTLAKASGNVIIKWQEDIQRRAEERA